MEKEVYKSTEAKMEETIRVLKRDLNTIRTGRASLSLLDGVKVDYYGTATPLNQLASLSSPESRTLLIQPWDKTVLPEIEKAILKANIGLTPNNDGKMIRISIPPLTEERRKELVKVARKIAEDARISSRNVRREANEELKKLEKEKSISEDDLHRAQDNVQEITDKHIESINEILAGKEKEIMEI
jgi:ribosome recycling factor